MTEEITKPKGIKHKAKTKTEKDALRIENKAERKKKFKRIIKDWRLWVMVLPLLIWLFFFAYKPMYGISIAFLKYSPFKGISGSQFIGLDNFKELMFGASSEYFWRAFKNTIIISAYGIIFGFPMPIILAIFLHEVRNSKARKIVQTVTYAPHFLSEVIVCSLLLTMLAMNSGLFNVLIDKVLGIFGIDYHSIQFMAESKYFRGIYTISGIWKEAGFNSIVFFSALCGISSELYEAARVDGASRLKQILHISLPGITPTIVIMLIIRVGNILNVGYEKVLLLYNPTIYDKADILSTYIYRMGVQNNPNYGMSTAASLMNSLIGFTLVILANRISKKFSETSLW